MKNFLACSVICIALPVILPITATGWSVNKNKQVESIKNQGHPLRIERDLHSCAGADVHHADTPQEHINQENSIARCSRCRRRNFFSTFLYDKKNSSQTKSATLNPGTMVGVPLLLGMRTLHRRKETAWLNTTLIYSNRQQHEPGELIRRPPSTLMNFTILTSLALLASLVMLLQRQHRTLISYLNCFRTSSVYTQQKNVLGRAIWDQLDIPKFMFTCCFSGFMLLIIFYFSDNKLIVIKKIPIHSLPEAFYQWGKLSAIIMALLLVKFIITWLMLTLFNMKENPTIQFQGYVNLLLTTFFAIAIAGLSCFMAGVNNATIYSLFFYFVTFMIIYWVIIIAKHLLSLPSYSSFYLFSYLCATELIPVAIGIRILVS